MTQDEKYIQRCLELARQAEYYVAPNPMVGAMLVSAEGEVLAEGWHKQYGGPHAEVNCFRQAEERGVTPEQIHQATLYVSLEPCSHYGKTPPCALLVKEKHPKRLVCGMLDPNPRVAGKGLQIVADAGIDVTCGVLEEECRKLIRRFLMLHEHHRPYITLKWAQTADGFLDNRLSPAPSSKPLVISTEATKKIVHQLRAENMAILVGSGTALMDNPRLCTTRWEGRNPVRILLDARGRVPASATMLLDASEESDYLGLCRTYVWRGIEQSDGTFTDAHNLQALCDWLAKMNIHSVLVEGGRQILDSFIAEGLYDEVHIEINPSLLAHAGTAAPAEPVGSSRQENSIDGNRMITIFK